MSKKPRRPVWVSSQGAACELGLYHRGEVWRACGQVRWEIEHRPLDHGFGDAPWEVVAYGEASTMREAKRAVLAAYDRLTKEKEAEPWNAEEGMQTRCPACGRNG